MKPVDVNKSNEKYIRDTIYTYNKTNRIPKFKINDLVRIADDGRKNSSESSCYAYIYCYFYVFTQLYKSLKDSLNIFKKKRII